ncbi:transcriptional regulator GcvA [Pollutimonas bauzanensis]|uniref:LysR family transcriptional regulator, glycine cleavage system transcriptional activator n=1 Tax=Pollutimonas bauzanensis TaxID=658167 RepID=A0A1M6A684_9BURK|nr:transcriptional regulator GcvA [Pollutimonas bauzanensis]SHI31981.1 LysR family transcriptional regulator, glycine cleavage system transcriptional activator [Pollutimonas bauzanensis]
MPKHFPKLNTLRAFEATARHLSFTRAASELHLTQTAISHQIKELERMLATQLFERRQNNIALTESGFDYLESIRPALAMIGAASDRVSNTRGDRLQITCLTAFAVKCLLPALCDFQREHPDIELRLTPVGGADRTSHFDFDVGIWYGVNTMPDVDVYSLSTDEVFPVCNPALLGGDKLLHPRDLKRHTILRSVSPIVEDDWSAWVQHACNEPVTFNKEMSFNGLFLALEAAINGLGICMGRSRLVQDALNSGHLIEPFAVHLPVDVGYHIAHRKEKADMPKVRLFREWMMARFS